MRTDLLNLLREMAAISSLTEHLFALVGDLFISRVVHIRVKSFSARRTETLRCFPFTFESGKLQCKPLSQTFFSQHAVL